MRPRCGHAPLRLSANAAARPCVKSRQRPVEGPARRESGSRATIALGREARCGADLGRSRAATRSSGMNQQPTHAPASPSGTATLRFDVVAGLTAAAVVLPKAMAYATVAGLPVAVGLYTAFIPMVIYALLGTSRVLSVSSTTTLAILAGTQLGLAVPDGDPARLVDGDSHADRAGRRNAGGRAAPETGVRRELHLDAGADRLQGGDRPRHRAGPGAEAARHPYHEAGILRRCPQRRATLARHLADHAGGRSGHVRGADRNGAVVAAFAGAVGRRRRRHRCVVVLRPQRGGRLDGRPDSARLPVADAAGPGAGRTARAGRARDRAHELHRDDRRGSRVRPP